jgi:hypothetical protein
MLSIAFAPVVSRSRQPNGLAHRSQSLLSSAANHFVANRIALGSLKQWAKEAT